MYLGGRVSIFQYPALLGREESKKSYIRGRLIDREFGVEYTKFEWQQIQEFAKARNQDRIEISGFVSWIDKTKFLLLPTRTTSCIFFICKYEGLTPPNNQYIACKGKKEVAVKKDDNSFYPILMVEDFKLEKPDFGKIKSDISQKDFQENMFEGWSNVDPVIQNLIAQNFVSSPSTATRMGGFTLSMFNHPRQRRLVNLLKRDIRLSIAPEILGTKKPSFDVYDLGIKHSLVPFDWKETIANYDTISNKTEIKLNRVPKSTQEHSFSLLSQKQSPMNLESNGLVKSDYPIVIEEHVERKRNSLTADLKATQFLIASHLNTPSIELSVVKKSINYVQKEIKKFVETKNFIAKKILTHNQMLNLDVDGRPMSAIMLAISRGRSTELDRIGFDNIKSTTSDFIKNLDMSFNVWKDEKAFGKIHPLASLSYEEERIISFLHNNGPHSIPDITTALNMNLEDCRKVVRILHEVKFVLYSFDSEKYDVVDQ